MTTKISIASSHAAVIAGPLSDFSANCVFVYSIFLRFVSGNKLSH